MKIVSLEKAKALKEADFKNKTVFQYGIGGDQCENDWTLLYSEDDSWSAEELLPAPTSDEILDELPEKMQSKDDYAFLECGKTSTGEWYVAYWNHEKENEVVPTVLADALAESAASMWICLKENDLLTPNQNDK